MTLIIIIIVVWYVCKVIFSNKPITPAISKVQDKLSNIYFREHYSSGFSNALQYFAYENGVVTLTLENGYTLTDHLANMQVTYSKSGTYIMIQISSSRGRINVVTYNNFHRGEWEVIIRILALSRIVWGQQNLSINVYNAHFNAQQIQRRMGW